MNDTPTENTPVIRMSIQAGIGEARAVTFETYLAATADAVTISAFLDKLNFCIDRQKAKYDLEAMEKQFEQETALLAAMRENLTIIDDQVDKRHATSGKRGPKTLSSAEAKTRTDCERQITERENRLKKLREDINAKKEIVKAGDIDGNTASATNS
jgi:hypothetical protein